MVTLTDTAGNKFLGRTASGKNIIGGQVRTPTAKTDSAGNTVTGTFQGKNVITGKQAPQTMAVAKQYGPGLAVNDAQVDALENRLNFIQGDTLGGAANLSAHGILTLNPNATVAGTAQINVPSQIPSDVLDSGTTTQDVLNERAQQEQQLTAGQQFAQYLAGQGMDQGQADYMSQLMFPETSPELATAQQDYRGFLTKAQDYLGGLFGRDSVARREELAAEQGLGSAQSELAASNVRLAKLQGELQSIRPQIETEAGQTRIGAEARLSPVERNLRAEIASEALVQAALAGNVEMIQNNVNAIMELELGDQERELNLFENQIKLEESRVNSLEGEAKTRAEQNLRLAQVMLDDRKTAIEDAREMKGQQADLAIAYIEATGDGAGAVKILNAQDLGESMRLAGPSLGASGSTAKQFIITSGSAKIPATDIQAGTLALQNVVGQDGYTNTQLYTDMLGDWLAKGALLDDFIEQFPPDMYLNPEDPTIPVNIKALLKEKEDSGIAVPSAYQ